MGRLMCSMPAIFGNNYTQPLSLGMQVRGASLYSLNWEDEEVFEV